MNYLRQINGFWNWRKLNTLSHSQMDLYFAILDCANTAMWRETFGVPNSTLMNLCQLSKSQLSKDRNKLTQLNLIGYVPGKKGKTGTYKIVPLYDTFRDTDSATDSPPKSDTVHGNINKNININKNYYNNRDFSVYSDNYNHKELEMLTRKVYPKEDNETDMP